MPTKFIIPPTQASYRVRDGETNLSVRLDGGASRFRADVLNASFMVDCSWLFSGTDYQYFRAFYNTETASGSLPFLIDLIIDDAELVEHEAHFMPGTISLVEYNGGAYRVSAQLEVQPVDRDDDYDAALVMLYAEYGSDSESQAMLNQLEQLANVDLPGSL